MREIDMSREAVTARLKLVSELRRLCLSLGAAKIKNESLVNSRDEKNHRRVPNDPKQQRK
jgi:predicted transcriptional regulator